MARSTAELRATAPKPERSAFACVGAGLSSAIALLYLLVYAGVLSVGRAEVGELGVLGVAGVVFLLIAVLLWFKPGRLLCAAVAVFQIPLAVMIGQLLGTRHQRAAG